MRLLAEPSGNGRWRRRATGVADRWSSSRKGYRTRLTVRPRPTFCIPQGHSMIAFRDSEAAGDSKLAVLVRVLYAVALNRIVSTGVVSCSERAKRACCPPRCLLYLSRGGTKPGGLLRPATPHSKSRANLLCAHPAHASRRAGLDYEARASMAERLCGQPFPTCQA